ncbi:unnamed protein product [Camellia sinensis]
MGKYMRKAKITGDIAVMELVSQSSLGVRTRAKSLALQRLQSTTTTPPPPPLPPPPNPESSYLQLRSRRLEKVPPSLNDPKRRQSTPKHEISNPNPSSRLRSINSGSVGSVSISCSKDEDGFIREFTTRASREDDTEDYNDLNVEPSFGENNLDFEGRESLLGWGKGKAITLCLVLGKESTRESTPCSLIRELDSAGTPGSTTRRTASTRRIQNAMQRIIPTTHEIEEFFASAEQRYNFDVVNDLPLPGRFEWVRVNH